MWSKSMAAERKEQFEGLWVIACLLIEKDGKFLFARQAPDAPRSPGKWFFPAGHVELGESLEEALKREGKEEVGVDIEFEKLVGYAEYIKAPHHALVLLCRCKIIGGKITPGGDVDKAEWVAKEDFRKYPLRPVMKAVVEGGLMRDFIPD